MSLAATFGVAKMDELQRSKLLRYLGEVNFDYTETQRQQVEYVYKWLVKQVGSQDWQVLTLKITQTEQTFPKKHKPRLDYLYNHIKLNNLRDSGRYDCTTQRIPMKYEVYDKGWRL